MTPSVEADEPDAPSELPRRLTLWSTVAVTMGILIGSGIFRAPATVADAVGSVAGVAVVWLVGGLATLCLALCVAELGTMFPRAGGAYVYLREAFGPGAAFAYGWTYLIVTPAGWAAITIVFAEYAGEFVPLGPTGTRVVATAAIAFVTVVNMFSMRFATAIQNIATSAKAFALASIAAVLFGFGDGASGALAQSAAPPVAPTLGLFIVGLVAALWPYDGIVAAASVFGEVRDPARTLPRALIAGVLGVTTLYLIVNAAYLYVLPFDAVAASAQVASDAMRTVAGPVGSSIIAACVMVSAFGCIAALAMTDPRVFFAMARDGLFFRRVGLIHPRHRTPHVAVALCGALTVLYMWVRTLEELAAQFVLGLWPLYTLIVLGMIRLRARRPLAARPYRTPAYPFVPAVFLCAAATLLIGSFIELPGVSLVNVAIILAAVPVYWLWRGWLRRLGREPSEPFLTP